MNRVVLFSSDAILHRVLPANAPRYCFTIWIDGNSVNNPDDLYLKKKHLSTSPDMLKRLMDSPLQRVLSRSVYAEEYEMSLMECMGSSSTMTLQMLESHHQHVNNLAKNIELKVFIDSLRELKGKDVFRDDSILSPSYCRNTSTSSNLTAKRDYTIDKKINDTKFCGLFEDDLDKEPLPIPHAFKCIVCGKSGNDEQIKQCARCLSVRYW